MDNRIITGVVSIFAAIIILAAVMVPVIQDAATTTQTISITNEGAADLKLSKISDSFTLDLSVVNDGSDLTITNGSDTITAALEPMFILSTDSAAIYVNDDYDVIAVWTSGGTTQQYTLTGDFSVEITENYLVIDDGADHNLPLPTSYMFVPSSAGMYGSFTAGGLNKVPGDPVIAAGYYAEVAAYNANNTLGDALAEVVIADDETITSVSWEIPSADLDQFNPDLIDFDPGQIQIQPIDIDPLDPGNQIMAVPTPTYTDGDWGYDVINGIYTIVSYSGQAGEITIPATVGGHPVRAVGKGGSSDNVFDTSLTNYSVNISSGITTINNAAFVGCSGLTSIVIPETVNSIGGLAFKDCTSLTSVSIPYGITIINSSVFNGCTSLTSVSIPDSVLSIENSSFRHCTALKSIVIPSSVTSINGSNTFNDTGIKEVLNLSGVELTTTSNGLTADSVQDHIDASTYIAPISFSKEVVVPNEYAPLYSIIPLIVIASILVATAGIMLLRRE